ncbi:FxsA family protein [Campylobacter mucosalis]|uniref:Putative membrane protein n=1 Tax=Campylobacter mucosalis CCUG 21559 TaxID=1032067 RepID=A0A6G5QGX0_9BACT|nr:FxsA family protein [Campylobacter mucosalis]QCD44901.1 putative membrane protein [Campylobacter mucosalis CCUG 21559]
MFLNFSDITKMVFLPYLLFELFLAYLFVSSFGFLNFVFEVIFSAFLGVFLMMRMQFFSGLLLILPGISTDILAILILFYTFLKGTKKQEQKPFTGRKRDDVIDVEVVS